MHLQGSVLLETLGNPGWNHQPFQIHTHVSGYEHSSFEIPTTVLQPLPLLQRLRETHDQENVTVAPVLCPSQMRSPCSVYAHWSF